MLDFVWNRFNSPDAKVTAGTQQTTMRGLSASWYSSKNIYQLERRAIFSKYWLLVTHKLRFPQDGDFLRFQEANYDFFVIRDRDGVIRAFHNVCRHRAFPVVTKDEGNSKILSCQYHGWSYGLNGNLAKAPRYQELSGFDPKSNGLFPIHVHIDNKGFIWVNLDSGEKPEMPWSEELEGVDMQEALNVYNFEDYRFDHTWGMSGKYNWKTLADNYNECYHCKTAHPDAAGVADLDAYAVTTMGSQVRHFARPNSDPPAPGAIIKSTFYFPNACMTVAPAFFYMMRCVPTSESQCSMEYEVYRHKDASDVDFEQIDSMFKRILGEDKWLCENAQKNLEAGVFISGEMHTRMESGPLFLQDKLRKILQTHHKEEERLGQEIWPAQQRLPLTAQTNMDDDLFCRKLDACGDSKSISW